MQITPHILHDVTKTLPNATRRPHPSPIRQGDQERTAGYDGSLYEGRTAWFTHK